MPIPQTEMRLRQNMLRQKDRGDQAQFPPAEGECQVAPHLPVSKIGPVALDQSRVREVPPRHAGFSKGPGTCPSSQTERCNRRKILRSAAQLTSETGPGDRCGGFGTSVVLPVSHGRPLPGLRMRNGFLIQFYNDHR